MGATATSSFESQAKSDKPIHFASTCPVCGKERVQYAYTRRALVRLLEKGQIIDAYCRRCDVVWPVSAQERDGYRAQV
jgi:transcription elongation factor Elf1